MRLAKLLSICLVFGVLSGVLGCNRSNTPPKQAVPGSEESNKTAGLKAGADLLQSSTPLHDFDVYLVGFHPMKDNPAVQMEAHHYCDQVNEDFAQCVLFDGNTKTAHLNGIEYIISERLFETLPQEERQYWHPHNYEILSGQLVAPGLPEAAEHALMAQKINTYGKTWHVWETDSKGVPRMALPMGPPQLAWSFNHDGEIAPGVLEGRDQRMSIDSKKKRQERQDLASGAHPQYGVDLLKSRFQGSDGAPTGVEDKKAAGH